MVCVSRTYHWELKSKEIFANLHNDLNNVIMIARAYLMIPFDSTTISK